MPAANPPAAMAPMFERSHSGELKPRMETDSKRPRPRCMKDLAALMVSL